MSSGNSTQNPLERAEQNFDETGPAIVTRRPAVDRLKLVKNIPLEEFRFAQNVAKKPVKVTLIGPDRVAQRFKWEASMDVYKGLDDFVEHIAAIQRQMISELVEAGCKYIQIDAPGYTAYVDQYPWIECARAGRTRRETCSDPSMLTTQSSKASPV